jgi:hypothetical protein
MSAPPESKVLFEMARRAGFKPKVCDACLCSAEGISRCPNCEGLGRIWTHAAGGTLSEGGLWRYLAIVS